MYKLNLMFEWGGGTLWCDNDEARRKFDLGPIEERLPLSKEILSELEQLSTNHDEALNWEYPAGPSKWAKEKMDKFDISANKILGKIKEELGSDFYIEYVRL